MPSLFTRTLCASLLLLSTQAAVANDCDRRCLQDHLTRYLDTMLRKDPDRASLSDTLRFVEDMETRRPGEGLWQNIEGYGTFRQDILDEQTGTAGTHILVMENGQPVLAAIRLKIEQNEITEIESTVVRTAEEGMIFRPGNIVSASEAMNVRPAPEQRNSRETMIDIAMRYPEGLRIGSFIEADAPFSDEAYRFENGQLMAGPGCTFFPDCENVREQRIPTLPGMQAEVAAVDEENAIVWLRMNFGPGSVIRAEGELTVWEMFKIYDGRIQAIEAFMEVVPEGAGMGW